MQARDTLVSEMKGAIVMVENGAVSSPHENMNVGLCEAKFTTVPRAWQPRFAVACLLIGRRGPRAQHGGKKQNDEKAVLRRRAAHLGPAADHGRIRGTLFDPCAKSGAEFRSKI